MIKLIATDLDGTFLNDEKKQPSDFAEVFEEMQKRGIIFVAASGRDYNGASSYFDGYIDKMFFLCDNGATVYKNGRLQNTKTISREKYTSLIDEMKNLDINDILVCTPSMTYVPSYASKEFLDRMVSRHYSPTKIVDDLADVKEDIIKVSVMDFFGVLVDKVYAPISRKFKNDLTVHLSGSRFMDVMEKTADKGIALRDLQNELGISADETMVFGDYYNDEPLLNSATYAFVMENAPEDLKQKYNYIASPCNEGGVTKAIKEYAFEKIK